MKNLGRCSAALRCIAFVHIALILFAYSSTTAAIGTDLNNNLVVTNALNFVKLNIDKISVLNTIVPGDLQIEELRGGITNYCFKCFSDKEPSRSIFVKHATNYIRGISGTSLTSERLRYEYDGIRAYSKYASAFIPKVYLYDEEEKYLVNEFLFDFEPLTASLVLGVISAECARSMGTLMGRSHARTHRLLVPDKSTTYKKQFENSEHFKMWQDACFQPLLDILNDNAATKNENISELLRELNRDGLILNSVLRLRDIYLNKKEVKIIKKTITMIVKDALLCVDLGSNPRGFTL